MPNGPKDPNALVAFPGKSTEDQYVLSEANREKLSALAEAYGISQAAALNVAVSDAFDSKVAAMRDAEGE